MAEDLRNEQPGHGETILLREKVVRLRAENERLTEERDSWRRVAERCESEKQAAEAQLTAARAEVERHRDALTVTGDSMSDDEIRKMALRIVDAGFQPSALGAAITEALTRARRDALADAAKVAETFDLDGDLDGSLPKGWEGCRRCIATAIRKLGEG